MRLLPRGRLAPTIKPVVSGPSGASEGGNDLGGGVAGKGLLECHEANRSTEIKIGNAENNSCKSRQCRHNDDMNKTYKATIEGTGSEMTSADLNEIKEWASQATMTFQRDLTVSVVEIVESEITLTASYATGEVKEMA